ncbi:MAG: hypothetical protein IT458_03840 [Planctomycetes bacterium]|nr:hypothetical protein [Planctomycetota bacterium]
MAAAFAVLALPAGTLSGQERPPDLGGTGPTVLVVPIRDAIGMPTVALVHRALRAARAGGARTVILDIDTPGGLALAMKEIETLLVGLRTDGVQTVGWVKRHALSAGAYLALACNQLYLAPGASLGAITPVLVGPGGVQGIPDADVRRKTFAALRSDVRALVERKGQVSRGTLKLVEAMVDPDLQVFEATLEDRNGVQSTVVEDEAGLRELEQQGAKVLQRRALGPGPIVLTAEEAFRHGLSKGTLASLDEVVRDELGESMTRVQRLEPSWSEEAVTWLDTMKPLLFLIGFLLLLVEFNTPGFGVPGILGAVLLGLAFFGSYLVGLAEWTEILLFFLGLGAIAVEIFVLPGTFVFGALGFASVVAALVLSQQPFTLPSSQTQEDILVGNLWNLLLLMLLVVACSWVLWRLLPRIPLLNRVLLRPPLEPATGASTPFAGAVPVLAPAALVGREGVADSDLRPAGIVLLGADRLDVVSEGGYVARGTRVRVARVEGTRVVVEPVADGQSGEVSIGLLVLLLVFGLLLVVAEVFLVSFGALAVLSALSLVSAVFLAFTHHGQAVGFLFLGICVFGVPAVLLTALRLLPRTRVGRELILSGPAHEAVSGTAADGALPRLLGKTGETLSDLRPSGIARIDGARVDVITRGEMLARGVRIQVIEVEGNRVLVARSPEAGGP